MPAPTLQMKVKNDAKKIPDRFDHRRDLFINSFWKKPYRTRLSHSSENG